MLWRCNVQLTERCFSYPNLIWQFIQGLKVSIWPQLVAIVSFHLTWNLPDVCALNPVMWNTMGCYIIALHLNSIKGHRNVNMMRACNCSWLLASNMLITRLHRLPSERAYQGVQLFPSAPATGNEGWGTLGGCGESAAWGWKGGVSMRYHLLHSSSYCHGTSGVLGIKCGGQGPHCKHQLQW